MLSFIANLTAAIGDETERCNHLRNTFGSMPLKHRDCLEFLMFHLDRVAQRDSENLVSYICLRHLSNAEI